MEEKIVEMSQLNKKNRAFIIYGPKSFFFIDLIINSKLETSKKNIQFFILENLIHNIKKFLKNIEISKNNEQEIYSLTLKYDSYVYTYKEFIFRFVLSLDH